MMRQLNLPPAELKLVRKKDKIFVWCILRKKELLLTPEEWVRQHVIHHLIKAHSISQSLIASEITIEVNSLIRRCDLVVFDTMGRARMIVECKAPDVELNEKVFYQIAQYNNKLEVEYLMLSNGIDHIISQIDRKSGELIFLDDLPLIQ